MRIPYGDFIRWAESVSDGVSKLTLAHVARQAGFGQTRLSMQKAKGYIEAYVVISYSRAVGLRPVDQLRAFTEFDLLESFDTPSQREILSQVPAPELVRSIVARLEGVDLDDAHMEREDLMFSRWIDAAVPHGGLLEISSALGMDKTQLSTKNTRANWGVGELQDFCRAGGLNYRWALVASGWLTVEEAGYSHNLLHATLNSVDDGELVATVRRSLGYIERQMQAVTIERRMTDNLG